MVRPANAQLEQKHAVGVVYLFTLTLKGWLRKMNMDEHCSGMEYIYIGIRGSNDMTEWIDGEGKHSHQEQSGDEQCPRRPLR